MRIDCKMLSLSACLFALLCLSSVGYATPPLTDVHLCRVLDFEDTQKRDSIYAATKHALDLNVGEPRTVRMIYFLPNDRPFRQEVVQKMKDEIRNIQTFFAEQMQAHGHGNKTFRFETNVQGEPMVHRVDGQHPNSRYSFRHALTEVGQAFDLSVNIYFIVIDHGTDLISTGNGSARGVGNRWVPNGGYAVVPDGFSRAVAAHELGHAFGLSHDFNDNAYIMSYGSGRNQLSACNAEYLTVHPYFNPDMPHEENPSPAIELMSPLGYSPGSKSIPVRLKISDPTGIHQVILFTVTITPHGAAGLYEMKAWRGLEGKKDVVIEFEYDGVIPSVGGTSLSYPTWHRISVTAVDTDGNVGAVYPELFEISPQYIAPLEGHTAWVTSMAFSPDGTMLASTSWDGTTKLRDVAKRKTIATITNIDPAYGLYGLEHGGHTLAFSPDGKTLALAAWSVALWDVATQKRIANFSWFNSLSHSIAFSPDGQLLAVLSSQNAWLYDVATLRILARITVPSSNFTFAVFSPDGKILALSSWHGMVQLWDVEERKTMAMLEGHVGGVSSMSFSPDGTILASSSGEEIKLWDVVTQKKIATLIDAPYGIVFFFESVSFSPDGTILAAGSRKVIKLWDVVTKKKIATLRAHEDRINYVAFSPDGALLASGGWDGTVKLWDMSDYVTPVVNIPDANLRAVIRDALDKPRLAPITVTDMASLTTLDASRRNIHDLTGLESATNLTMLNLTDNPLSAPAINTHIPALQGRGVEVLFDRPRTLVKISGDGQEGAPDTVLGTPLVIEVRDQDGNVLADVTVAFAVTAGDGWLSVETTVTDSSGRAESVLTLGPNPGTNTVEVSIAGIEATFNAMGVGMPATPVIGGDYPTWHLPDGAMIRLGKGHMGKGDRAVAFSPDDQRLAVASGIGVWLYDVGTSSELTLFTGHRDKVTSVSFSPNGMTLASGSRDGEVKLWDIATGENIATFGGHRSGVTSVALSSDGITLASGSYDRTIKLWNVIKKEYIAILEGHTHFVTSVAFSPDGTTLASGSGDETVRLWDVATRQNIVSFEGHARMVTSVSFTSDGTILASGSWDGTVKLWDVVTRENIATHAARPFGSDQVNSIAFSPDGTILAIGTANAVKLWSVTTRTNIATFAEHKGGANSVAFSPDGMTLAIGANSEGLVKLLDMATQNVSTLTGHISSVRSIALSPNGEILASGSDSEVALWDVTTGRLVATLETRAGSNQVVAFSPSGKVLAMNLLDGIKLWDVETGQKIVTLEHRGSIHSVVFSPDGTMLAAGTEDTIGLWDIVTGENIANLEGHTSEVRSMAFSPDGKILASGSFDNTIRLWDVEAEQTIAILPHNIWVNSISFSPDGTTLAGSDDKAIKLWDVATRETIATFGGYTSPVISISFSPDGTTLAGSDDKTIRLWDVATRETIATFEGHKNTVTDMAFSSYGTTLASGSGDGTILLWDVSQYITPVVYIPDTYLRAVIRDALGKSRFASITTTDMASLTTLDASNRNIRELEGLEFATNLTELNLVDNPLSTSAINTHIPALQNRGVEVLIDKLPTPDFDGDGIVGIADFLLFLEQFGFSEDDEGYDARFDLDGDGIIGVGDFLIFVDNFGKVVSSN